MTASDRLAALERMLGNRPDDPRLRFGLALEYLNAGRLEDGVRELAALLGSRRTTRGTAWGRLGGALYELGRDEEEARSRRTSPESKQRFDTVTRRWRRSSRETLERHVTS